MLDLTVERLRLQIENATGQEHRIRPITTLAFNILADRLGERWATGQRMPNTKNIEKLSVPPINLSLNQMSDEQAANNIANAVLEALALKIGI